MNDTNKEQLIQKSFVIADKMLNGQMEKDEAKKVLVDLNQKGITEIEMTGFSKAMKYNSKKIDTKLKGITDTCGTGGDQLHTFNISTTTSFVLAGAGIPVAKHGNRSVSSLCGSADVLEALGVNLQSSSQRAVEILESVGIVFLFATEMHPKMKNVMPIRKSIKGPTIFNTIGPLSNPLELENQVIGVYKESLMEPMIQVMSDLGVQRPVVVYGYGGMDELSLEGENKIAIRKDNTTVFQTIEPSEYGLKWIMNSELKGGTAQVNAEIMQSVLKGEESVYKESVLLNAGFCLYQFKNLETVAEGIEMAREIIDSGKALSKLNALIKATEKE